MPHFLQTAFLGGLIAIAIPILIHLFFRLKTKRVELGTIRFLRIVLEENARRRKVMRWLLLALRMAFVALLVGLFARPYFSAAETGGAKELLVILIDQSATMQLKGERGRLIEQAVSEAKKLVESAGPGTKFELAFFDHQVRPLTMTSESENATRDNVLERLQTPKSSFGATNYGSAIAWARDICVKAPAGRKQLHLFTDLQRSGLDWTDVEAMPADVTSYLHDFGNPVVNNVAVIEIRTPRPWIRPGETTTVKTSIQHGGAFTLTEIPIVMEIGRLDDRETKSGESSPGSSMLPTQTTDFSKLAERITKRERVKLEPGSTISLDFELPPLSEGLWQGRIVVEYDDDLAFDNQRFFAIAAKPAYKVLVLNGGDHNSSITSETYFVEAALRLANEGEAFSESPFDPAVVVFDNESSLPNLSRFDAVILSNVADLKAESAEKLASFVRGGGGLLVFTGEKVNARSTDTLTNVGLNVGVIGDTKSTVDLPFRLAKWDTSHPVLQPLSDPQHGDLRRLIFAAYTQVTPSLDANTLVEFGTGHPAVLERHVGDGTVLWVTISCGRDWSDWSRSRLFLPLLHQMLGYEVGMTQGGRVRSKFIDTEMKDDQEDLRTQDAKAGKSQNQTPENATNASPSIPGVFQFQRYADVVNTSPRESDVERCNRQEFEDRFAMKFVDDEGSSNRQNALKTNVEFQRDEIWHWVACALLAVILLEGFVGNRTTA